MFDVPVYPLPTVLLLAAQSPFFTRCQASCYAKSWKCLPILCIYIEKNCTEFMREIQCAKIASWDITSITATSCIPLKSLKVEMSARPSAGTYYSMTFSPFRRFMGRVDVLNHFEPALSVCCPLWAYLVLFHDYGVK